MDSLPTNTSRSNVFQVYFIALQAATEFAMQSFDFKCFTQFNISYVVVVLIRFNI